MNEKLLKVSAPYKKWSIFFENLKKNCMGPGKVGELKII